MFAGSGYAAENTAAIPDFTGIWERNLIHYEPPPSGPGPIVNKMHKSDGTMDQNAWVGDYTSPILKPEAAEAVKKRGEIALSGMTAPDPHNQCRPEPPPFTVITQFAIQMLQQKDEVVLLYQGDHKVRHIRMNVPHPARVTPTWLGDSVGHYEDDTLVIDTIGLKVGPLSMVDLYGTPYSAALHVIERYRLIDGEAAADAQRKHDKNYRVADMPNPLNPYGGLQIDPDTKKKGLQVEITVDDPGMFTVPWSGLVTYRRAMGEWPETVCAENTREYYANKDTASPVAAKPDF